VTTFFEKLLEALCKCSRTQHWGIVPILLYSQDTYTTLTRHLHDTYTTRDIYNKQTKQTNKQTKQTN